MRSDRRTTGSRLSRRESSRLTIFALRSAVLKMVCINFRRAYATCSACHSSSTTRSSERSALATVTLSSRLPPHAEIRAVASATSWACIAPSASISARVSWPAK